MEQPYVLVVEDDRDLSEIYAELLSGDGLHCEIIRDGQLALQWLGNSTPNAVLLDMHLPGASGVEILRYIRSNPRLEHVPVMAVTADSNIAALIEDQVEIALLKPASMAQVSALARRLLKEIPC